MSQRKQRYRAPHWRVPAERLQLPAWLWLFAALMLVGLVWAFS